LIASYNIFQVQFQLITTAPIQGTLRGYVNSFFGELLPEVSLGVGADGTLPITPPPSLPVQALNGEWKRLFVAFSSGGIMTNNTPGEPSWWIEQSGPRSIYVIEQNFPRAVLIGAYFANYPVWSPDGSQIAYANLDYDTGLFQIYAADQAGGNRRRLTTTPPLSNMVCLRPQWSADGTRIMLTATRGAAAPPGTDDSVSQIYTMNADGTNPQPFTAGSGNKTYPAFSRSSRPGVDAVVFLNDGFVFSVDFDDVNGQNIRQISADAGSQRRFLAASRKHNWVAFNETPAGLSTSDLIVLNTITGVSRKITGGLSPTFTPDGNWIASNVPWLISIDGTMFYPSWWSFGDDQLDFF
jgi:hypothetical protein